MLRSEYSELSALPGKPVHGTVFAPMYSAALCCDRRNSLDTDLSLSTLKLKERIIRYLENRQHKMGTNDAISWRGIWIESGATEEEFRSAMSAAAETEIVFTDADHVRLRSALTLQRVLLPTNPRSSEELCGHVGSLVRLFLQFGKKHAISS